MEPNLSLEEGNSLMTPTPFLLRQLWTLIENTRAEIILTQDDSHLAEWVIEQLRGARSLDHCEAEAIGNYIRAKTSLIRDLASER